MKTFKKIFKEDVLFERKNKKDILKNLKDLINDFKQDIKNYNIEEKRKFIKIKGNYFPIILMDKIMVNHKISSVNFKDKTIEFYSL